MVAEEIVLHLHNHEQHTKHQPILLIHFNSSFWVCMLVQLVMGFHILYLGALYELWCFEVVDFRWSWNQDWKMFGLEKQPLCLTWVPTVPLFILLSISMFSSVKEPFVLIY